MKKITFFLFLALSFCANASDWFLDEILSEKIADCRRDKGVFGSFKKVDSSSEHCVSYHCISRYKVDLRVGKSPVKYEENGVSSVGRLCTGDTTGVNYLLKRFDRFKSSIDYYLCYSSCAEDFTSKRCSACLKKNSQLSGCSISDDHQRIECPAGSYRITQSVDVTLKEITKEGANK